MLKGLLAIVCVVVLPACAVVIDSSAAAPIMNTRGQEAPYGFEGSGPIMKFALVGERQWTDRVSGYCEIAHISNLKSGWPYNDEPESHIDKMGCGFRFRIY